MGEHFPALAHNRMQRSVRVNGFLTPVRLLSTHISFLVDRSRLTCQGFVVNCPGIKGMTATTKKSRTRLWLGGAVALVILLFAWFWNPFHWKRILNPTPPPLASVTAESFR